jgi:hypothetical protein
MKDAMDAAVASLPDPISLKFLGANAVNQLKINASCVVPYWGAAL